MATYQRYCFAVFMVLLIGCGSGDSPELGTVSGQVTLDGDPLPNATVTFTPSGESGGRPSSAITGDDGEYELKYSVKNYGAPPGKYKVQITTATTKTDSEGNDVEVPEKLPAKYNAETELEEEVKPGSNEINFKLDSKGEIYRGEGKRGGNQSSPGCS